ncbi:septal ring lytic transglycosylase RlpA family protein [bacterium]|nr:septal ring lytic transglycosylase RlpA family protein [bacterium]
MINQAVPVRFKRARMILVVLASAAVALPPFSCYYPAGGYPDSYGRPRVYTGKASYYGKDFHGRKTANGEVYDMYKLTAAHRVWPFGTLCRVTNLSNRKKVDVRINDRGPFIEGRILDLSYGAARAIDGVTEGIMNVRIEILKWGKGS